MSWEETLRQVVRRYYRAGPSEPPEWVNSAAAGTSPPVTLSNATCGDRVVVYQNPSVSRSHPSVRIWLDVAGCAICKASAEMAVHVAESLSPPELETFAREVIFSLERPSDSEPADLGSAHGPAVMPAANVSAGNVSAANVPAEDIETLLTLRDVPGRSRCASLPWEAVLRALESSR